MELDQLTELIMWIEQGQFLVDQDYANALGPEFAAALKLQNAIAQSLNRHYATFDQFTDAILKFFRKTVASCTSASTL
jgi:hypothetical protein